MEKAKLGMIMLFEVTILAILIHGLVAQENGSKHNLKIERQLKRLSQHAVKTIKTEDGDIIDCVDIYKQPAFGDPLLKNHTIQERQAQNWWVLVDDVPVGYWPSSLFKDLNSASKVQYWVGQVADGQSGSGIRIITQMGSGHSPNSGYGRAAFSKNIAYVNAKGQSVALGYLANFLATGQIATMLENLMTETFQAMGTISFMVGHKGLVPTADEMKING